LDGGYYAIKGFSYQFDKTVLEILNSTDINKRFYLEQIQDINDDSQVIQVKFKETQTYAHIKIREPIIQLIDEFKNDKSKDYILYAYFKDKKENQESVDIATLNNILQKSTGKSDESKKINSKIDSITDNLKNEFISKFKLYFAPEYDSQFTKVIQKIEEHKICNGSKEVAIFFYANISEYLKNIVIIQKNPKMRYCTQKEIWDFLTNGKKLIFNSSFLEYQGEKEYLKYLKNNFIDIRQNQKNILMFGEEIQIDHSVSLSQLTIKILDIFYKKATYDIEPLTFIYPDAHIANLKKELIEQDIVFNDGFESIIFNEKIFHLEPIKNRKIMGRKASESLENISFKFRLLSYNNFCHINNHLPYKMIYCFDCQKPQNINTVSYMKIEKINTLQIYKLFKK